ncbi:hypothetical protein GQ57_25325 [Burkholderia sp. MSh2]|uniref:Amino acid transporter n=1 Tax=Burkholderia paludis TaxID=1506587 RepID=A0A6J5EQS0_9BURK|nr:MULTISPECIES: hypothetical protein [Burkholderia]KEZ03206.1 hypothetical protein GQ57_25325 [Burkholderia sp. MSh2]KFG94280.1 hypothetical protein GQ56_0127055 [Burkholderia paludis]CAB3767781.1 hypothetical protein LMG30113_05538 [Burkholderia paludis]VWC29635.1 amino acid transporter [Burkholderia paludis]
MHETTPLHFAGIAPAGPAGGSRCGVRRAARGFAGAMRSGRALPGAHAAQPPKRAGVPCLDRTDGTLRLAPTGSPAPYRRQAA